MLPVQEHESLMADPAQLPIDSVDLKLVDAAISIRLEIPAGWTTGRLSLPDRAPQGPADGTLWPRLDAISEDRRIRIRLAAAAIPLPVGLVPAVVYWAGQHRLAQIPDSEEMWDGFPALAGWSKRGEGGDLKLVGAAWVQIDGSVVELLVEGPATDRERLSATWDLVRKGFRCAPHDVAQRPAHDPESWWSRAKALRDEGRLDEAIALVERDGDRAEALLVQADLHAERLRQARAEHRFDVARDAWQRATCCARAYAASATGGGEGMARSVERDRILAELGPAPV